MAELVACPHCKGTGVNYIIVPQEGKSSIESVDCPICAGVGRVAAPKPERKPAEATKPAKRPKSPEFWPILVPLGLFGLFFLFLWI
jgi:hypothetical protein